MPLKINQSGGIEPNRIALSVTQTFVTFFHSEYSSLNPLNTIFTIFTIFHHFYNLFDTMNVTEDIKNIF